MGEREWFRKERWTPEDEADFFSRLERAQAPNRAQYLRIQAYHLQQTESPALLEVAVKLLELLVREYPAPNELAQAHHQRARCLELLGRDSEAEAAFRDAFEASNAFPNSQPDLPTGFALFVLRKRKTDRYDEALARLSDAPDGAIVPVLRYRHALARALLLSRTGRPEEAAPFVTIALEESNRQTSGLPYHPRVGLVTREEEPLHGELLGIVARSESVAKWRGAEDFSSGRPTGLARIGLDIVPFATYTGLGAAMGWLLGHPGLGGALGAGLWMGVRSSSGKPASVAKREARRGRAPPPDQEK